MMNGQAEGREYVFLSIIGRDRPGIVASVSKVLCLNRYNVEALSQTAMLGQFAMILIASASNGKTFGELERDCSLLMREQGLDIRLKKIRPEEMVPYKAGETKPFVVTVRGEDRPGLAYGVSQALAELGINITNLDARVASIGETPEYIQIYEVDIPGDLDLGVVHEKLRQRAEEMRVAIDLQHRGIFRAMNQI